MRTNSSPTYLGAGLPLFEGAPAHSGHRSEDGGRAVPCRHPDATTTRGLLVRDPYATWLLEGSKSWEVRGRPTQIRGPIVIVKSGTGKAFGTVDLVQVLGSLRLEDLTESPNLPPAERMEFTQGGLPYEKTFAYVIRNPRWFKQPIPYNHPSGAVTWVNLPSIDLERVAYAPSSRAPAQLDLV
jgi:hypothetical protein